MQTVRQSRSSGLLLAGLTAMFLVAVFLAGGCASQVIKNNEIYEDQKGFRIAEDAEIPDNTKNRKVLDVVAAYQRAVATKDFGTLKRLVSEDYYENAGTTNTTEDDYGNKRLPEIFELMANHAEEINYTVVIKRIQYQRDRALVDYEYKYAYKYEVGEKPTWDAGVEVNRLELVPADGRWRITSGL